MKKWVVILVLLVLGISPQYAQNKVKIDVNLSKISEEVALGLEGLKEDMAGLQAELEGLNIDGLITLNLDTDENYYSYSYNIGDQKDNQSKASSSNQNRDVFHDLANTKGIEVVYITKSMLGMMNNMDMPGVNIGKIAGKLETLQVYSAEGRSASNTLRATTDRLVRSGNYETLMLVKDEDSKTAFYLKKNSNDKKSELLMLTEDGSEVSVIRFLGEFSLKDIQNLTKEQTKKNKK
ncbi:DUF4252 domain-containing protein [Dysgonomonas macrotermitis]|uniref:DUF4252 domain-containing protein n=1 Tax=Dysgonomonas macrotermitis TaxID=1346286 RepID=A0A1M5EHV0_9BACT|nr:DUF4252 domain-containing protein [Dysgonomonas macrotermitis]SHF78622.1 protein of unknown function [Dysgonomonas macrotermitis]